MHPVLVIELLVLLALANGAPVFAKKFLGARFTTPLDAGTNFWDGQPIFGASKTIRGIVAAVTATVLGAWILGLGWALGMTVGIWAMAGDLFSSFVKRRMKRPSSSRATFLDQVPESLFPLLACRTTLALSTLDIGVGVGAFFVGELIFSRLLFKLRIRERPY